MVEFDPETKIAFGLCDLGHPELGLFSIAGLEDVRMGQWGGRVKRDMNFREMTLQEAKAEIDSVF
jgi:hypothetical protein